MTELIRSSIQFYRKHLLKCLLYLLCMAIPTIGIGLMVFFIPTSSFLRRLLSLIGVLLTIVPLAAFIRFIASKKQQIDIGSTPHQWQTAIHLWWKSALTYVLITLILLVASLPLLFPAIFLSVWLAFSLHVVALEGKGVIDAIRMSRNLSKWRWWSVAWLLFAPFVIYSIVTFTPYKLVVFGTNAITSSSGVSLLLIVVLHFLAILWIILTAPLLAITTTLLYLDLSNHPLQKKPQPKSSSQGDT